jgi:phospholipid/cholesterol/gamma-HCH transport system permease protein
VVATEAPATATSGPAGKPASESAELVRELAKPAHALATPLREVGSFFAMTLDTAVALVTTRFAYREFVHQCWFVARVSIVPGLLLTVPFSVIVTFILDILLSEIGAADLSGAGAALATLTQTGPITSVLVVGGAGATAMCADLGARTIREELDAMRVMGIDPIQRLVVPRVLALTLNAFLLNSIVCIAGVVGSYFFAINLQHVTPGAFADSLTTLMGLSETVLCFLKAIMFGLAAGLIACYKGITVGGGPQGVGNAVNETVVYTFVALFVINVLVTGVGVGATK